MDLLGRKKRRLRLDQLYAGRIHLGNVVVQPRIIEEALRKLIPSVRVDSVFAGDRFVLTISYAEELGANPLEQAHRVLRQFLEPS